MLSIDFRVSHVTLEFHPGIGKQFETLGSCFKTIGQLDFVNWVVTSVFYVKEFVENQLVYLKN